MKRPAATSPPSAAKRIKLTPFIPRLTRIPTQDAVDMCTSKTIDEAKCVAGRVKMLWPATEASKNKASAIIELGEGSKTRKIQLKLGSDNEEHLKSLAIRSGDRFRLSLQGAQLTSLKQIPKLCTHGFRLELMNGFEIEWTHSEPDGTEESFGVNCWAEEEVDMEQEVAKGGLVLDNGWYTEDEDPVPQTTIPAKQLPATKLVSTMAEALDDTQNQHSKSLAGLLSQEPPNDTSIQADEATPKFQAGFKSGMVNYPAISSVAVNQKVSLIGIVVEASEPKKTQTGEWMRFLHIIDPSNFNVEDMGYSRIGLKINFFSKNHKYWLPHPRIGDAVVLRNIKITAFQDHITGTVIASGLSWAAFSPDSGKIHHGPPNSAPEADRMVNGNSGALIKPYYTPGPSEVAYCVKLSDWWHEVRPEDMVAAEHPSFHHQSFRAPDQPVIGIQRVHRLIQDSHPDVEPNGYFDCTVELLRGFSGYNPQIYTLYVTDYTDNDGLRPVGQDWCPQELSQAILQLEAWDRAADVARDMQPGQFYSIKNARMKVAQSGYLEAKIVQPKITHLKGNFADKNPHLQSLLERKKKRMSAAQSPTEIPTKTIADIEEGLPFNCTVELLHVSEDSGKVSLFVTDYTDLQKLVGTGAGEPWAEGMQGKVMKIYLSDEQANAGRTLQTGSFYRINKVILSNNPVYRCYCCALSGTEKLIHKLNSNSLSNEFLNGVLRRRERWKAMVKQDEPVEAPKVKKSKSESSASTLAHPPKPSIPYKRIKDISLTSGKPEKHIVYAQVVDLHPTNLREAFYQICAQCRKEFSIKHQACFDCYDTDRKYVQYHYQVWIKIRDEDGAEIIVSINDQSDFFDGLVRGDITKDPECYTALVQRLRSIMGHLLDKHGKQVSNKHQGSFHLFEINSWMVPDGKVAFCLRKLVETS